jgi:hypothetical protein
MHSFHHSRGRILFEVLCALAVSVSCVQAWMQTGASALLGAAAAAALSASVHLFDLRGGAPAVEVSAAAIPPVVVEDVRSFEPPSPPVEPKPKAPRKTAAKKPRAKAVKAVEPTPEPQPEPEADTSLTEVEHDPVPLAPLFQPEPFLRQQQRGMFGRKAGFRP